MVRFSIIIPCYNQAHFLNDCLASVIAQTYTHWEAIVVNDGSTDQTEAVANSLKIIDNRIQVINKKNGGLSSARNEGIKNATGNRIIFLDSDDFLYENCLLEISNILSGNQLDDFTAVKYGYSYITEDKSRVLHNVKSMHWGTLLPSLFSGNIGPPNSICLSRTLCEAAGFFDEELKSAEDWDYWLRAAKAGAQLVELDKTLVFYRYVYNSMSRNAEVMYAAVKTTLNKATSIDTRITIPSDVNKVYNYDTSEVLKNWLIKLTGVSLMQGKINEAIIFFNAETKKSIHDYTITELEMMCSYLSFRYWYSKEDICNVFDNIYPNFKIFFNELGLHKKTIEKTLFHIFRYHFYLRNQHSYGRFVGGFFNFMLREKYK